ncbi:GNAT family N-acetyltransferase [Caballeronia sp. ATUFL_M1_KS5A]|uniref:GNAT family N-acetyltransferase n=1 Tax=Caballeronia sp. ATUFL_M1_KS5A TaxID=2921778 RepID=UPI002027FF81|nr:GNAT family N-acetyltransferase [Caballeronia sp. ATUFL_M1_KS5A]
MKLRVNTGFDISLVAEMAVSASAERSLAGLLDMCFPDTFAGRTYLKQLPQARLIHRQDGEIVGQAGLDYRIVRIADEIVRIVGIVDLCVAPHLRGEGRASAILKAAAELAANARANFTVLFADKPDLYLRNDYQSVRPALITWLAIDERTTYGVQERDFSGIFMVRPIAGAEFPQGKIDLLGYLF